MVCEVILTFAFFAADASELAGSQHIELTEDQLQGETIPLRVVKFARVNSLTILIASNQGDEESTIIQKIALIGTGVGGMDVSNIKDISKENE